MAMEGFDVMFSGKSLQESKNNGDLIMNASIELFTRLICFMTPNVELKTLTTFYIIVFGHDMLGPVIVVICNEQYKTALYKKLNNSLSNDVSIIFQPKLHFEI